jgi:hypothetical protein
MMSSWTGRLTCMMLCACAVAANRVAMLNLIVTECGLDLQNPLGPLHRKGADRRQVWVGKSPVLYAREQGDWHILLPDVISNYTDIVIFV